MARNLVRFDPFAEFTALREQLFSEGLFSPGRKMMPTTDIYTENDSKLTVEANLPGFDESDISVDVDQGAQSTSTRGRWSFRRRSTRSRRTRERGTSYARAARVTTVASDSLSRLTKTTSPPPSRAAC